MRKILNTTIFVLGCLGTASAAQFTGTLDLTASFSTQSTALTFGAAAPIASVVTNPGVTSGSNITYTTFGGLSTDFTSSIRAASFLDVSVGANSSVSGVTVDAFSGVVRITNSGGTSAGFSIIQDLLYSVQTFGPVSASIVVQETIERFNTQTQDWDIIGSLLFGIGTDQSNSACNPACNGGSSNYNIAGNSTADIRIHTRLNGSAIGGTSAVPEPATFGFIAAGLGALALLRRRIR